MGILSRVGSTTKTRYARVTSHNQHDDDAEDKMFVLAIRPEEGTILIAMLEILLTIFNICC